MELLNAAQGTRVCSKAQYYTDIRCNSDIFVLLQVYVQVILHAHLRIYIGFYKPAYYPHNVF
jgi:hypothetical protein